MKLRLVVLLLAMAAAGCDSPEASRTRGGGPGADIGNRPQQGVKMHEGSNQYWRTPDRIPVEGPSLEPARHAQQLSRQ
jgi:hypothetical protein